MVGVALSNGLAVLAPWGGGSPSVHGGCRSDMPPFVLLIFMLLAASTPCTVLQCRICYVWQEGARPFTPHGLLPVCWRLKHDSAQLREFEGLAHGDGI